MGEVRSITVTARYAHMSPTGLRGKAREMREAMTKAAEAEKGKCAMSGRPTKVHLVTLLVVDSDDLGEDEVQYVLERTRYPNHCIAPRVMETRTREVDWSDDHPLNGRGWALAAEDLFAKGVSHG